MNYNYWKILHIFCATGFMISFIDCYRRWKSIQSIADFGMISSYIQTQTLFLIIPCAIFQLISGFSMIGLEPASHRWLIEGIIGFILLMIIWFLFVYFLSNQTRIGQRYLLLSYMAVLISLIFLMTSKS